MTLSIWATLTAFFFYCLYKREIKERIEAVEAHNRLRSNIIAEINKQQKTLEIDQILMEIEQQE